MTLNKKCSLIMNRSDFLKRASSRGAGIYKKRVWIETNQEKP